MRIFLILCDINNLYLICNNLGSKTNISSLFKTTTALLNKPFSVLFSVMLSKIKYTSKTIKIQFHLHIYMHRLLKRQCKHSITNLLKNMTDKLTNFAIMLNIVEF